MTLETVDYSKKKATLICTTEHVDQTKEDFPMELKKDTKVCSDKFLLVDKNNKRSCEDKSDIFYSFAMRIMFLCERVRPDVELGSSLYLRELVNLQSKNIIN